MKMNLVKTVKITVISALCLYSIQSAAAEIAKAPQQKSTLRWAPQLGISSFALKAEGFNVGAHEGLVIGASGFYGLGSDTLDAEFGLQLLQTGGVQKGYLADGTYMENSLKMSYLAIPLGVRWKLGPLGDQPNSAIYLKGGLVPSFLMASSQVVTVLGARIEKDIKGDTNGFDLMAQVGVGASYDVGNGNELLMDLLYVKGTSKVLKEMNSTNEGLVASVSISM